MRSCWGCCPRRRGRRTAYPNLDRHWDENTKQVITEEKYASNPTAVIASDTTWGTEGTTTWYVANGNVTIGQNDPRYFKRVTVTGDVHLILTDGSTLTVYGGIHVADDDGNIMNGSANGLTIYGQQSGTGTLTAQVIQRERSQDNGDFAGIGGNKYEHGGAITINGGTVNAIGGMWAAGIGGGDAADTKTNGSGGNITINGGTVTAACLIYSDIPLYVYGAGAGIGGGSNGAGGNITINGGMVTATGQKWQYGGAGIGGCRSGNGGTITINGGTVIATGGGNNGAGIGGGNNGTGGAITINGGTVTATGIKGAGIGDGDIITISGGIVEATGSTGGISGSFSTGTNGNAFITASSISDNDDKTDWSGIIFQGDEGQVYGNPTLAASAEIPSGKTLTIPDGSSLTIDNGVTLINNGSITMENGGAFINNGTLRGDKITPTPTTPSGLTATYGQTLAEVSLPTGWVWDVPTTFVGDIGSKSFQATYNQDDSGDYNTVQQNLTVTVGKAAPIVNVAVSPSSSTGMWEAALTVTVTGVTNGAAPTGTVTLTGSNNLNQSLTLTNGTASYIWTGLADGNYTVTAAYGGDSNYNTASDTKTFDTSKQEQDALAISPVGNKTYGDAAFTLSASGGSGTGAVTFTSSDPSVISILGTTATIHKAGGPVTITVTKAEDENYNAATATLTITVAKKAVVFKANDKTVQQGGTMPTFDYAAVTLVQGDSITKEPTATCTATNTNTAGTFEILFSGAELSSPDSYEISYEHGTLTVTAKPSGGGGGGSYTPPTYPPTVEKPSGGGGTPSTSPSNPKPGDTVTVTPKPDSGYEVDKITVTDRSGRPVEVTKKPDGTYTFTQPSGQVTIEIEYAPIPLIDQPWNNPFTDVFEDNWYYEAVRFVHERGLMNGYSDGRFGSNDNLSRAQLAQILFHKEGRPEVNYRMDFSDVAGEMWYAEAIRWAASQGIVGGYGNGTFGPNDPITREQLAVMLWRYSGSSAAAGKDLYFNDTDEVDVFALEAMCWAVENGILNGYGDGRLSPQGQATRAQVAQMLKSFVEKQESK